MWELRAGSWVLVIEPLLGVLLRVSERCLWWTRFIWVFRLSMLIFVLFILYFCLSFASNKFDLIGLYFAFMFSQAKSFFSLCLLNYYLIYNLISSNILICLSALGPCSLFSLLFIKLLTVPLEMVLALLRNAPLWAILVGLEIISDNFPFIYS